MNSFFVKWITILLLLSPDINLDVCFQALSSCSTDSTLNDLNVLGGNAIKIVSKSAHNVAITLQAMLFKLLLYVTDFNFIFRLLELIFADKVGPRYAAYSTQHLHSLDIKPLSVPRLVLAIILCRIKEPLRWRSCISASLT